MKTNKIGNQSTKLKWQATKNYISIYIVNIAKHIQIKTQILQSEINLFWHSVKTKDDVIELVKKKLCELGFN